jgi:hypothetical protein
MAAELSAADIALKYIDMARNEILEKVRFVNQTLGAYVLGSSAVSSWFYQSVYRPTSSGALAATEAEKSSAAIGLALMLSYLALGVIWIIHHNERMVTALAFYQRDELHGALKHGPPMWERSESLGKYDSPLHARLTILVEELIVLAPPLAAAVYASSELSKAIWWPRHVWFPAALVANTLNVWIAIQMFKSRGRLRDAATKQTPPRVIN